MASLAQSLPTSSDDQEWLWSWLKDELSPYPGRGLMVARMVVAATLVMITCMTFRLPYGAYGALFALNLSRESLKAGANAVRMIVAGFVLAGAYTVAGAMLVLGDPMLRFLWVIGTFFLIFFLISATKNYAMSTRFAYFLVVTIPLWDRPVSAEAKVEGTLWAIGTLSIASLIALVLEIAYAALRRADDLIDALTERLAAVDEILRLYANDRPVDAAAQTRVTRLAMLGTSRIRRLLQRSGRGDQYVQEMGALVALTGRLTDLAANLPVLARHPSDADRARIASVADRIGAIANDLKNGAVPRIAESGVVTTAWPDLPLFAEIERTISLIPQIFSGSQSLAKLSPAVPALTGRPSWIKPGELFNPEHVKFGLRGCLAASLCYVIYNGLFWPEISTAVTTCLLTALSSIGGSRQKQVLRFAGAVIGGFVLGIGAQIFVLPYIDSIAAFTVVFVVVAVFAAWIMTSSTRLSYLGVQIAVAFFLINLQEFKIQTSLAVARDRVVGIFFGLLMMWLAFDRLWSTPAVVQMKKTFVEGFRLLAQLAREPVSTDLQTAIERSDSLRETINAHFDQVRALADGVLFEFGPARRANLELREHIRQWQPQLRTLFVLRTASWRYRARVPGFELPDALRLCQEAYDDASARVLEDVADRIEKPASDIANKPEDLYRLLSQRLHDTDAEASRELPAAQSGSFVTLIHSIDALTNSLATEIATGSPSAF